VLEADKAAGDRLDMVYFYDDVGTQNSLMISKKMWQQYVRPCHARLIELAHRFGKPVMELFRAVLPLFVALAAGVLLITYVPWLSTGIFGLVK